MSNVLQLDTRVPARIDKFEVHPVVAPLAEPLVAATGRIPAAPLVLLDIHFRDGTIGRSYIFTYTAMALKAFASLIAELEEVVRGAPMAPVSINQKLEAAFRLMGSEGMVGMAIAAIDMAVWDALAKQSGRPLGELLGGELRPVPAYWSAGMLDIEDAIRHTEAALSQGYRAFKIKIGRPDHEDDMDVIRAIRATGGEDFNIMADYNQSLTLQDAVWRINRIEEEEDLVWVEEPLLHHDFEGHADIRASVSTPVQIGENWCGFADMKKSIAAGASDYAMPDIMKIGGVTGWMKAIALAEAQGLRVSPHLFPEISAQVMCATPNGHWLEYLDFAGAVIADPLVIRDGNAVPSNKPGAGLDWDMDAVAKFKV